MLQRDIGNDKHLWPVKEQSTVLVEADTFRKAIHILTPICQHSYISTLKVNATHKPVHGGNPRFI